MQLKWSSGINQLYLKSKTYFHRWRFHWLNQSIQVFCKWKFLNNHPEFYAVILVHWFWANLQWTRRIFCSFLLLLFLQPYHVFKDMPISSLSLLFARSSNLNNSLFLLSCILWTAVNSKVDIVLQLSSVEQRHATRVGLMAVVIVFSVELEDIFKLGYPNL